MKRQVTAAVSAFAMLGVAILAPAPSRAMSDDKYDQLMLATMGVITAYTGDELTIDGRRKFHVTSDTIVCVAGKKVFDGAAVKATLTGLVKTDVVVLKLLPASPDYAFYKDVAVRIDPGFMPLRNGMPELGPCAVDKTPAPTPP